MRYDFTHKDLRNWLHYDPKSGRLHWKVYRGRKAKVGDRAGCSHHTNHRYMTIHGNGYCEHVIIWFWMTGNLPEGKIDHINCDGEDNRWKNLRAATQSQNMHNSRRHKNKIIPHKGVSWRPDKLTKAYRARIYLNDRNVHLGYFDTAEEAHVAYIEAAKKHFGEFARAA